MVSVGKQLEVIFDKLDSIDKRLFHDNGNECMQSKVNRHEQVVAVQEKRWKWLFGTTASLVVVVLGRIIYDVIW
jgi:hypothetical protein